VIPFEDESTAQAIEFTWEKVTELTRL